MAWVWTPQTSSPQSTLSLTAWPPIFVRIIKILQLERNSDIRYICDPEQIVLPKGQWDISLDAGRDIQSIVLLIDLSARKQELGLGEVWMECLDPHYLSGKLGALFSVSKIFDFGHVYDSLQTWRLHALCKYWVAATGLQVSILLNHEQA